MLWLSSRWWASLLLRWAPPVASQLPLDRRGVFSLLLAGKHEVYRQFLRLPDGAVIEMFGAVDTKVDRRLRQGVFLLC